MVISVNYNHHYEEGWSDNTNKTYMKESCQPYRCNVKKEYVSGDSKTMKIKTGKPKYEKQILNKNVHVSVGLETITR